jgi:predicted ATP-grasp superfamily ATP-dependent carboligase
VLGGDYQGLGIVRSLGKRGIPVLVLDDEISIARFSRYSDRGLRVASIGDGASTIEMLLDYEQSLGLSGWVLFATRDETVAAIARNRERLAARFRVPIPPWEGFRFAYDKRRTYELAEKLGIPTPRTWYPRRSADLAAIPDRFPLAVKPAVKTGFFEATRAKAWRANDRAELAERFTEARGLASDEGVMVQDLIPGDGETQYAYCALFRNGEAKASMVARRKRQHPAEFGRASTHAVTLDVPELEELSKRFLREIDYSGLAELEYKFDERDGQYKLLDVNARTWGYHSLGARAGVDFPYLLYLDQLGHDVPAVRAGTGVSWMRLLTDVPTAVVDISAGRLNLRDYMRSLFTRHEEAVFSLRDPVPGIVELFLLPYLYMHRGF